MTREEFEAKWGKAIAGQETLADVAKRQTAPPPAATPRQQAAPKPMQRVDVEVAQPPKPPAARFEELIPPEEVDPGLRQDDPLTYGEAASKLLGSAASKAVETVQTNPSPRAKVRSWDNPDEYVDTSLPYDPIAAANAARLAVMDRLKRAKEAVPTPDELLKKGTELLE